jgi:diguanylate cyclase (GGDEF)-like protein
MLGQMPEDDQSKGRSLAAVSETTINVGSTSPDQTSPALMIKPVVRQHNQHNPNEGRTNIVVHRPAKSGATSAADACLVLLYPPGPDMGRRFPLSRDEIVVGRGAECDIQVDRDSVSRRHARVFRAGDNWSVEDLQSTNGTYVNDVPVTKTAIRDADLVKVGAAIFKFLSGSSIEASYHEEIYKLTIVDALTGAHNKRYFLEFLEREIARCAYYRRPLSLLMFDIDHFKQINDKHGHLTGDYVLREMSRRLLGRVRREQLFARYGGEEFAVVLPETDFQTARVFGEHLRQIVADTAFEYEGESFPVTVSVGVATVGENIDVSAFIKVADDNLYRAKRQGRNRVVAGRETWPRWRPDPGFATKTAGVPVVALSLLGRPRLLSNTGGAAHVDDLEGVLYSRLNEQRGRSGLNFGVGEGGGHLLVAATDRGGRSSLRVRVVEAVRACAEEHPEARFATGPVCMGSSAVEEAISGLEDELDLLENGRYLPQSLALASRALEAKDSPVAQAKHILEFGEAVLQWLALCASVEILRRTSSTTEAAITRNLVGPVSMGRWHEILSSAVKELVGAEAVHVAAWRSTFGNKAERSAVLSSFNDLIALRNNFAHDPTANDEHTVREIVDKKGPHLRQLVRQELRPVLALIPAEVEFVDFEEELQGYRVTRLIGERTPVPVPFYSRRRMKRGLWLCDLIADRAVPLEPLFVRDTCPKCGARELFLLHRLDELSFRNPFTGHVLDKRLDQLPFRDDDKETLRRLGAR